MGMSDEAGSEASGALTHTATFAIPRGVLVTPGMAGGNRYPPGSEDGKDSIPSGRPVLEGAAGGDLAPMGNCRLYKNSWWLRAGGPCSLCGNKREHPSHEIPQVCLVCGESFTALENNESACLTHPLPEVKVIGATSHAVHKYKIYHFDCCPQKTKKCSSKEEFLRANIPHGFHT